jgi:hypothetical protein
VNPRTTGILFLVAALLGGAIWWSNRHESEKKVAEDKAKRLFGEIDSNGVEWFELGTSDGRDARLERRDGVWHVAEPIDAPADATAADGIAGALAAIVSESEIEEPQAFSVYGLADGARVVRFGVGGQERELRLGKKTPVGANNYAATGPSGAVYTIASYRATSLEKPLDDLRERRPLRFDRNGVARIEATWEDGGVVLEKKDGVWKMTAPMDVEADDETIETLLSDLVFLRGSGFVDQPPPDAETGLDRPAYRVVISDAPQEGKEPVRHELEIGSVLTEATRVARGAEPALYQIPNDRYEKLPRTVVAFRHKQLAEFVATDAKRFELTFAGPDAASSQSVTVTGESAGDAGWTTQPDAWEPGKAERLVAELARLRADDIAAEQMGPDELAGVGLSPARVTLRVLGAVPDGGGDAPVLADVLLGVQKNGKIVAKVPSRDTVYLLSDVLAEYIPISLDAYRSRFVTKAPPAEAATAPAEGEAAAPLAAPEAEAPPATP